MSRLYVSRLALPFGQLSSAGVNFLVMMGAARALNIQAFAWLSGVWIVYAVVLNAQRVIVNEQVFIRQKESSHTAQLLILRTSGLSVAFGMALILAVGCVFVNALAAASIYTFVPCFLLMNDALRYGWFQPGSHAVRLFLGDATALLSAAATLAVTFVAPSPSAATFTLTGLIFSVCVLKGPGRISIRALLVFVTSLGTYAKWALLQVGVMNFLAQISVLVAAPLLSASSFATIRALQSALGPLTTPATALQALVLRAWMKREYGAQRWLTIYSRWLPVGVGGILALTAISYVVAGVWLPLLLPSQYHGSMQLTLPILLGLSVVYLGIPGGVHMRILRLGRQLTLAQVVSIAVGLIAMPLFAWLAGAAGLAWGGAAQAVSSVAVAYALLFKALKGRAGQPATVVSGGTSWSTRA